MDTITVDENVLGLPSGFQDETVIYPGAGRIKSRLLSIKDKTAKIARKVISVVKETARKIWSNRVLRIFIQALVTTGFWVITVGSVVASYLFLIFLIIALINGAWGAALLMFAYCVLAGIVFRVCLAYATYLAAQRIDQAQF